MEVEPVQAKANLRGLDGIVFTGIIGGRIGVIKGLYRSYEGLIKGLYRSYERVIKGLYRSYEWGEN